MINPIYSPAPERYDNGMKFRRCGQSGILLPEISLGLWHNFGDMNTFANSQAMAHYAFDRGITHFDLANNYGPSYGSAEETFGMIMKKSFTPYRDELFISTKAGHDMWPGPYGEWGSRKYLMSSLNQSLKRMNLEYVDIFYSHRYDPDTPLEETLQALVDIVRQGKALYVGISKYPKEAAEFAYKYLEERDVHCLLYQGRYNLFNREPEEEGILQQAKRNRLHRLLPAGAGPADQPLPEWYSRRFAHGKGGFPEERSTDRRDAAKNQGTQRSCCLTRANPCRDVTCLAVEGRPGDKRHHRSELRCPTGR